MKRHVWRQHCLDVPKWAGPMDAIDRCERCGLWRTSRGSDFVYRTQDGTRLERAGECPRTIPEHLLRRICPWCGSEAELYRCQCGVESDDPMFSLYDFTHVPDHVRGKTFDATIEGVLAICRALKELEANDDC